MEKLLGLLPAMPQGSLPAWLAFILLALGMAGQVLVPMVKTSADRRRAATEGKTAEVNLELSVADALRRDVAQMRENHRQCEERLARMETRVREMERAQSQDSHLARWTRDGAKRIVWLNAKAYLSIFAPLGVHRDHIEGKTFTDLFDADAAREVDRLDATALAHPEMAASNIIQLHPGLPPMVIVKIAATAIDGALMFEGYAYRTNDRMISDGLGAVRQLEQIERSARNQLP